MYSLMANVFVAEIPRWVLLWALIAQLVVTRSCSKGADKFQEEKKWRKEKVRCPRNQGMCHFIPAMDVFERMN